MFEKSEKLHIGHIVRLEQAKATVDPPVKIYNYAHQRIL